MRLIYQKLTCLLEVHQRGEVLDAAEAFAQNVRKGYQEALGLTAETYVCRASDGALVS